MLTYSNNSKFISGTFKGKVFGIPYTEQNLADLIEFEKDLNSEDKAVRVAAAKDIESFLQNIELTVKETSTIDKSIVKENGKYYYQVNGINTIVSIPESFIKRMQDSIDKGISIEPLLKFWQRLLRNKKLRDLVSSGKLSNAENFITKVINYVNLEFVDHEAVEKLVNEKGYSKEVATEMVKTTQVRISAEGLLQTYKVSKEITKRYRLNDKGETESYDIYAAEVIGVDPITGLKMYADVPTFENEERVFQPAVMGTTGEDFYCGTSLGSQIRIGQTHKLQKGWDSINISDSVSCVPGLHVGGLNYIRCYQHDGTETHNVLVDPAHIGAVPDDNTGAIRCIQYFVLDAFKGVNGSIYHSSTYGKQTDDEWDEIKADIKAEMTKRMAEAQAKADAALI